jgi:hypothetical protein
MEIIEETAPAVCVCGKRPCITKHKNGYLVSCIDTMHCAMRSAWSKNEKAAIESWNLEIASERRRKKEGTHGI